MERLFRRLKKKWVPTVDAVVFGGAFLANPELPTRFLLDAELNVPNKDLFYAPVAEGYIDYPAMSEDA